MKYFNQKLIIPVLFLLFVFQSCEPGDLPTPDNTQNDRELWNYEFSDVANFSLYNQPPAIDEAGNIYAIGDIQNGGEMVKLAPDGTKLWGVQESYFPLSRLIYQNNKLFYIHQEMLVCRNADNGEKLWEKEVSGAGDLFALKNDKIYITKFVDDGVFGKNYLVSYTTNGDKRWEQRIKYSDTDTISFPNAISVNGNNIYLGILAEVDNSEFAIINYTDQGNDVARGWTWLAPENFSVGGGTPRIRDFSIDDDKNIIFGMNSNGDAYIFSVNASGTENRHVKTTLGYLIASVSVDGSGNCYAAYNHCDEVDNNGVVWSSKSNESWDYTSLFAKAPAIDDKGNLYFVDLSTMFNAVSPQGDSLWSQYYGCNLCNNEYHNLTINRNGDVIVISKAGITAFKGSGTKLAQGGWPKIYGNLANTSSK